MGRADQKLVYTEGSLSVGLGLPTGVYFVKIEANGKASRVVRVVKQLSLNKLQRSEDLQILGAFFFAIIRCLKYLKTLINFKLFHIPKATD
jgi:hypothetical protein